MGGTFWPGKATISLTPTRRSASIKFVKISLIRVRCPSPFDRSQFSTSGSRSYKNCSRFLLQVQ